jgi:hypothetical protein
MLGKQPVSPIVQQEEKEREKEVSLAVIL